MNARLGLMGAFELSRDGVPVELPVSAQRLLAYVALQGKPVRRPYVAGQLWLDGSDERAGANLRSALWRLHRAGGGMLSANGRDLELAAWVSVDVDRVTAIAHRAIGAPGQVTSTDAVELCRSDDLLPDWYEEWVWIERERFRQLRLHALERLCERLTVEGRLDEALEAGLAAVRAEPLRETAHRAMIGVHLAEGNVAEAQRQFDTCARQMSRALGVRPSPQTARLLDDGLAARRRLSRVPRR